MSFETRLRAELVDDLANNGQGEWRLLEPLVYVARDGRRFAVPTGFSTDYASVPRVPLAYLVAGNTAHRPAVLHDWLIRQRVVPRREADDLFYEACQSIGLPEFRASVMHLAVRSFTASMEPPGPEGRGHDPFGAQP